MAIQADIAYEKSREATLVYEDARYNSLMANIADSYTTKTDFTVWGSIIRAIAMELARLEYAYAYDMVSLEPKYLTPPDIKRIYAAPLGISKTYPEDNQFDLDYKALLVDLIPAYLQGTTVAAIEAVILAYTGEAIPVEELYRQVGNGIYDESDRNALSISLSATSVNPLTKATSLSNIQTLTQTLYSAIDLAKPAHIGLYYSLVFGSIENVGAWIAGITDRMEITFMGVERSPLSPLFTYAPMELPTSPDTEFTAIGKVAGLYLTKNITAIAWAALLSDDYRAEYLVNDDGSYTLDPAREDDRLLIDASGNPTGVVSRAQGVLAPRLNKVWQIKSDRFTISRLS